MKWQHGLLWIIIIWWIFFSYHVIKLKPASFALIALCVFGVLFSIIGLIEYTKKNRQEQRHKMIDDLIKP